MEYVGRYRGSVITRDRAYHQGSAYPWLLGPLVTALVRTRGRGERTIQQASRLLEKVIQHMRTDGLGLVCELFDGDFPQHPGGALASAPAAGELLRAWAEDICAIAPPRRRTAPEPAASQTPVTTAG
jgi:glycogen debranching enzyme